MDPRVVQSEPTLAPTLAWVDQSLENWDLATHSSPQALADAAIDELPEASRAELLADLARAVFVDRALERSDRAFDTAAALGLFGELE